MKIKLELDKADINTRKQTITNNIEIVSKDVSIIFTQSALDELIHDYKILTGKKISKSKTVRKERLTKIQKSTLVELGYDTHMWSYDTKLANKCTLGSLCSRGYITTNLIQGTYYWQLTAKGIDFMNGYSFDRNH